MREVESKGTSSIGRTDGRTDGRHGTSETLLMSIDYMTTMELWPCCPGFTPAAVLLRHRVRSGENSITAREQHH